MDKVFIEKCSEYENSKNALLSILSNFECLKKINSKSKVLIKANLVSALPPEKGATTNYLLLSFLVEYLKNKGAKVVIGDSPGGQYNKSHLDHISKITKMNETGAELNYNFNIKNTSDNKALFLKNFDYTSYIDDFDFKINFCKLKTHAMMKMSASVKNLYGTIPGLIKSEYHYRFPNHDDFANMLIDLNEYFKFDLNIVDAIIGMEGNGPTMGKPKKIGCIIASTNPYALDYICAKVINLNPNLVNTIVQSEKRGLFNHNEITLNEDINKFITKDFELIENAIDIKFYNHSLVGNVMSKVFENKPYCDKNSCIKCQKCKNICPKKAITMEKGYPVIDREKCIKCYCCQEFCPVGAMRVKTNILNKILNRRFK